jgi:hypothetical protein
MWHGHAADARPFCKEFSTRFLRDRLGSPDIVPRDVFGPSPFAQDDSDADQVYVRGGAVWQAMVQLAERDVTFRQYLVDHEILPEDPVAESVNQAEFVRMGFNLETVGGNDSSRVQAIVSAAVVPGFEAGKAIAFDISSMTRAWHGAIIRQLRAMPAAGDVEAFFCYVPAKYKSPPPRPSANEFVAPVDGFAALSTPDLPVAAVMGLGYEKDRALGLQQLLDPARTILMVPKSNDADLYYPVVRRSNRHILERTLADAVYEYSPSEPAATFATLASIVGGLRESHRVVLASLGPKIFGILCFLLASRFSDVSVWRVSSGVHGLPRDAEADINRIAVLSTVWGV